MYSTSSFGADSECHIIYGLFENYRPYEWIDEDGQAVGMNIDLLKALSRESGCSYEIVADTWNNMLEELESGNIDMMSISPTSETEKFSLPLTQSIVLYRYIFSRTDAPSYQDLDSLAGKTVSVIKGSYSDKQLTEMAEANGMEILRYPSHEYALKALSAGTGDAFVSTLVAAGNVLKDKAISNIRSTGFPILPSTYGFAVNKSNTELYVRLNSAMDRVKARGEYFDIVRQWSMTEDSSAKWVKYVFWALGILAVIFVFVMLWNKSLYYNVRKKTASLNEEIAFRQATEEALTVSNKRFQYLSDLFKMVLDAIPEQIYLINRKGEVVWANMSEGKDGKYFSLEGIHSEIMQSVGSSESFQINKISDDAESWHINGIILDRSEDPLLLVISNITENVKLRDEALMAARLAALGEMAANVAHEINNPTGLIIHNINFLRQFYHECSDYTEKNTACAGLFCGMKWHDAMLESRSSEKIIDDSLYRIKKTIDDLKEFSRPKSNVTEVTDLSQCLEYAVRFTGFMIKKYNVNFTSEIKGEALPIMGNAQHIEQAIINLIQNACYSLTERSRRIKCCLEPDENGKYMIFSVTDEGRGMSKETQKRACSAFFTTRKNSGGTGLGLSITSRIIKEHKGRLTIDSEEGKGTCVALYFPVTEHTEAKHALNSFH